MIYVNSADISKKTETAITVGNFDGLHAGHQLLLNKVIEYGKSNGMDSLMLSFNPHPASILRREKTGEFEKILTTKEKIYLLEKTDLDIFAEYPFNRAVADMTPEDFVKGVFVDGLKCKALVIGEGYRFGRAQSGNVESLKKLGEKYGFRVIVMPHLPDVNGQGKVSSAVIREYIKHRDFESAAKLMKRPYFILGEVKHGREIGRKLGIPTANIFPEKDKLLPQNGVYVTKTHVGGRNFKSVTSIGTNPTVGEGRKTVETHILDFEQMIYGETIRVDFYKWLRGETKFSSLEELSDRIKLDIETARDWFVDFEN